MTDTLSDSAGELPWGGQDDFIWTHPQAWTTWLALVDRYVHGANHDPQAAHDLTVLTRACAALLYQHQPDHDTRCTHCHNEQGIATPWPCPIWRCLHTYLQPDHDQQGTAP